MSFIHCNHCLISKTELKNITHNFYVAKCFHILCENCLKISQSNNENHCCVCKKPLRAVLIDKETMPKNAQIYFQSTSELIKIIQDAQKALKYQQEQSNHFLSKRTSTLKTVVEIHESKKKYEKIYDTLIQENKELEKRQLKVEENIRKIQSWVKANKQRIIQKQKIRNIFLNKNVQNHQENTGFLKRSFGFNTSIDQNSMTSSLDSSNNSRRYFNIPSRAFDNSQYINKMSTNINRTPNSSMTTPLNLSNNLKRSFNASSLAFESSEIINKRQKLVENQTSGHSSSSHNLDKKFFVTPRNTYVTQNTLSSQAKTYGQSFEEVFGKRYR